MASKLCSILLAMEGKKGSQRRHDRINEEVYNRAWASHPDALAILKNYEWTAGSKDGDSGEQKRHYGEIDVLVQYPSFEIMYEIKSCNRYRKAVQQYKRYCKYHPDKKVIGVYVSPFEVRRIKL